MRIRALDGVASRPRAFGTPRLAWTLIVATLALPVSVAPQSGPQVVEQVLQRYSQRVASVNEYTTVQEINGIRATFHFEKRTVDGHPTFVSVSVFTVIQEALDKQRDGILAALVMANLGGASIELEVSSASYGRLRQFLSAAGQIAPSLLGDGVGGVVDGALAGDGPPLDAIQDILVRSAVQAGLDRLGGALGGATGEQIGQLAATLAGLGDESILGQLGKIALGQLKSFALEKVAGILGGPLASAATEVLSGAGVGGLADIFGAGGGRESARGPNAVGGVAQAGLGALMGGVGLVALDAIMPDLDALDESLSRMAGPDVHEILRAAGRHTSVEGSEEIAGHDTWVLGVTDLAALDLPDAADFDPTGLTLHIDKDLYVVREVSLSGDFEMDGEVVSLSMETRFEDYREVDGLLHPFRTATLIRGMESTFSDEERAGLAQMGPLMEERMKEIEAALADVSPEQRAAVERMLRQQMPQTRQMMTQAEAMAAEQPTEIMAQVVELRVNRGRPESLRPLGLGRP